MAAFSAAGVCAVNCVRALEEGWCRRASLSESSSNWNVYVLYYVWVRAIIIKLARIDHDTPTRHYLSGWCITIYSS